MKRTDKFQDIRVIADAICGQSVTPEQVEALDHLLAGNPEAQQFYYDYIEMHVQMLAEETPSMEVVRRRLQVDEVIIRPSSNGTNRAAEELTIDSGLTALPKEYSSQLAMKKWIAFFIAFALLITALVSWLLVNRDNEDHLAEILEGGTLQIEGLGKIESNQIYPGLYTASRPTTLSLISGELLVLEKGTQIKLYNTSEIEILRGRLSLQQAKGKNIVLAGPSFQIHSEGGEVTIDLRDEEPKVTSSGNSILVPKRWRPNHYWPFESRSDRVVDYAGNATGIADSGTSRVKGLVGKGAYLFDNSTEARINVGSGGGTAPATGSFSVTDGVTIEALVVPHFNSQLKADSMLGELDEIFRKDQTDKDHRMLLSFQSGKDTKYLRPEGIVGESIAFGLYLVGQGYHSLRLPLDGKEGRPTLAELKEGNAHHIVGTYDVRTGLKAIYIDGEMLASYQYPPGSKMLSGGSGMANIGNSPNTLHSDKESYSGIIDEVAFYDFALPAYMVQQHYQLAKHGANYFNVELAEQPLPVEIRIPLPSNEIITIDPVTGLITRSELMTQK